MELPADVELLRTETRRLVDRELRPRTIEIEREKRIPDNLVTKLRELGYFGLTIPESYGGQGVSTLGHLVVQEELGRAHAAFNMLISGNNGIGVMALVLDGTEEQKRRFLPRLASGEWIAAFALTEPGAGSDAQAIETRAARHGDVWTINGVKHYISRGDVAQLVTVFAKTESGITAFVVERGTPGFRVARIQESMGSDVVKQAELVFEDCAVPDVNRVGEVGRGFQTAMRVLDLGRLSLAARCLGTMEELLAVSVEHAKNRVQFGKPIAEQQAIQLMLADTAVDIALLRPSLYDAAQRRDAGERVTHDAAMLKLFASEALGRAADRAVQIHGGMGFMRDCVVEHIYREARMMRIVEGTSEIQRLLIARGVLAGGAGGGSR
ncbi:MAG TPA: acyl-CoA dehydrogenase family protein [Casimicrobiaceae bacterium]|nr:acyl-CoA dehydrogenase family protein [Casimicrobiaceae bacterium]